MSEFSPEEMAVGRAIKAACYHRKGVMLGRKYKPNERHSSMTFWNKAGRQCIELGAEAEDYVVAAFEQCRLKTGPFPNNMFGPAARQWYAAFRRDLGPEVKATYTGTGLEYDQPLPVDQELATDLEIVSGVVYQETGSTDLTTPGARALYRLWAGCIKPHLKVVLGYGDDEVRTRHAVAAKEFFTLRPNYVRALARRNYPMEEIQEWLTNAPQ